MTENSSDKSLGEALQSLTDKHDTLVEDLEDKTGGTVSGMNWSDDTVYVELEFDRDEMEADT